MEPTIDPNLLERGVHWLWTMLVASITALGGLGMYLWNQITSRIRRSEQNIHEIRNKLPSDYERAEVNRQRDNIAKLFDELKKHSDRDEDMHRAIMTTMAHNHTEVLMAMSNKADRRR